MLLLASLIGSIPSTTHHVIPHVEAEVEVIVKTEREVINDLISHYAGVYRVSEATMHHIIKAESNYQLEALGDKSYVCKRTGQVSPSYGLVQVNRCWHEYPIEQLQDPEFAISFLAENLSKGQCKLWSTCPQK